MVMAVVVVVVVVVYLRRGGTWAITGEICVCCGAAEELCACREMHGSLEIDESLVVVESKVDTTVEIADDCAAAEVDAELFSGRDEHSNVGHDFAEGGDDDFLWDFGEMSDHCIVDVEHWDFRVGLESGCPGCELVQVEPLLVEHKHWSQFRLLGSDVLHIVGNVTKLPERCQVDSSSSSILGIDQ